MHTIYISRDERKGGERGSLDSRSIVAECCKAISGVTGAYADLVS